MRIRNHRRGIMRLVIPAIALIVALTAIPWSSWANEKLSGAKHLDLRAERILKKARLLESLDALDEEESDRICIFATQYEEAEWIKTRVYKTPFHDDIAMTLQNISSLYKFCHAPLAQKYLHSILRIKENLYTEESEEAASAHDALGDFNQFYMMGFKKAITHYEKAKQIRIKLYGDKDPRVTKNYKSLAITLFYHKGGKSKAEQLFLEAIAIRKASPANQTFPVYKAYIDAGIYYSISGNHVNAISYFKKALTKVQGLSHNDEIIILSELGRIYLNKDDLKMSFKYAKGAYDKSKVIYKKSPTPNFLQTIEQLLDIYKIIGDKKKANLLEVELKEVGDQLLKGL